MSWDVLLLKQPDDPQGLHVLPGDDHSAPVGSRSVVQDTLRSAVPDIDLSDPAWGVLESPAWSIEVNIGTADPVESIMLHVRGGQDDVLPVIFHAARALGCYPLDCSDGEPLREGDPSGWHAFQEFRDGVVAPEA